MKRNETILTIERIAEGVAQAAHLELVEVELKGSGNNQLLRVVIDKEDGVTHGDCELVSRTMSAALDEADPIEGAYELEVTSPGVERKLRRWREWERFRGQRAKVVLRQPVEDLKYFDGAIVEAAGNNITVEIAGGRRITFPFEQVERANLKFEW